MQHLEIFLQKMIIQEKKSSHCTLIEETSISVLNDPGWGTAERALLAWPRTSLPLMAFGFGVERFGLLLSTLVPSMAKHSSEASRSGSASRSSSSAR